MSVQGSIEIMGELRWIREENAWCLSINGLRVRRRVENVARFVLSMADTPAPLFSPPWSVRAGRTRSGGPGG